MIKKFKDYDSIQIFEGGASIEPGGYELQIIGAKVEQFTNCEILKVAFDIVNNEKYAGFYSTRFKAAKATNKDAKWSGIFDVFIPKDDGTENDGYTKTAFKRFITSVEKSNEGYVWDWNELSLKGKMFGGVFGREEFKTKEGEYKFATKCRFPRSIESIRTGNFTIPDDKLMDKKTSAAPFTASLADMGNAYQTPDQMSYGNLSEFEEILSDGDVPL
jgi:hypothetical protein